MPPDLATARRNKVLNALTDTELSPLLSSLTECQLTLGARLYTAGQTVPAIHFPTVGVVSIVAEVADQKQVEVATIGFEGVVGLSVYLGSGTPTETAAVQVAGVALSMSSDTFREVSAALDGPIQAALRRYAELMFTQLARNAACNRVHKVRQRAARWLLTTADRMHDTTFELTQEFLAQMLAVRRPTVSEVAQRLAEDGTIRYTRGTITVLDRQQLHVIACDCYDVLRQATDQAFPPTRPQQNI